MVSVEISWINDAIFHSFILFVILVLVHVESSNQKRDHLLEVFGAIRSNRPVPVGFCQFDIGEKVSTGEVFRPACVDQCVSYLNRTVISVDR